MSNQASFSSPHRRCRSPLPPLDAYASASSSSTGSTTSIGSSPSIPLGSLCSSPTTLLFGPLYDALERHTQVADQFPDFDSEGRSRDDIYLPTSTASGSPSPPGTPPKTVRCPAKLAEPITEKKSERASNQRTQTPLSITIMKCQSESADSDVSMLQAAHARAMADVAMLSTELHNARRALSVARSRIDSLEEKVDSLHNLRTLDTRLHTLHLAEHAERITALRNTSVVARQNPITLPARSLNDPKYAKNVDVKCPKCSASFSFNPFPLSDEKRLIYEPFSKIIEETEVYLEPSSGTHRERGFDSLETKELAAITYKCANEEDLFNAGHSARKRATPNVHSNSCGLQRVSVTTKHAQMMEPAKLESRQVPSRVYSRTKIHAAARLHVKQMWASRDKRQRVLRMHARPINVEQDEKKTDNQKQALAKASRYFQPTSSVDNKCSVSPHATTSKVAITISTVNTRKNRLELLTTDIAEDSSHKRGSKNPVL